MVAFRAVIFDLGGVLIAEGEPVARRAWEAKHRLGAGQLDALVREAVGPGWVGGRTEDQIRELLGASTGLDPDGVLALVEDFNGHAFLDPTLAAYAARIRGRMRVAALSNAGPDLRAVVNRKFGLDGLVDLLVVSAEEGVQKPDPAIYERTAGRLGVATVECVLVDDVQANVEGAQQVGMTGVLHRDPAATIRSLDGLMPDLSTMDS